MAGLAGADLVRTFQRCCGVQTLERPGRGRGWRTERVRGAWPVAPPPGQESSGYSSEGEESGEGETGWDKKAERGSTLYYKVKHFSSSTACTKTEPAETEAGVSIVYFLNMCLC